jgi:hypothetical protein
LTGRALALAAGLLAAASPVLAYDVVLSLSRSQVAVGEQFTLTVEVRHDGVGNVPQPELPNVPNIRFVNSYSSRNFSYVNGKMTASLAIQHVLVADEPGEYTLGPAVAGKDDDAAKSNTVALQVVPAGSSTNVPKRFGDEGASQSSVGRDLIVLAKVDDEEPWVGEQITYTFTFLRRVRILEGTRYTPPASVGFWAEQLDTTEPREVVVEGQRYIAERVRTALFPTGEGEYTIGEAVLQTAVEDRASRHRQDPFDIFNSDPFGFFRSGREVRLATEPITVRVRPLPEEGKPAGFSGAVGRFHLKASADRQALKAGEPVTLRVTLGGEGNTKVVPAPDLVSFDDFKIYESESTESTLVQGDKIVGTKTWEYVLVPTSGGEVQIPAVRMSAFDPSAETYTMLATEPIPLQVEATDLDQALALGGDMQIAKERVRLRQRDIRWVKPLPVRLRSEGGAPWARPWFLAAHVVPLVAVAGSAALRRHREKLRSDVRYARRRQAARAATKRLAASQEALRRGDVEAFYAELSGGLRGYVADRLHLAAANLEEGEVRSGLGRAGVPDEVTDELFELLGVCDSARFSALGSDAGRAAAIAGRARDWLAGVERR